MSAVSELPSDDVLGVAGEGRVAARRRAATPHAAEAADSPYAAPDLVERSHDPWILLIAGTLMAIGVVMVYSASVRLSDPALDWSNLWTSPLRQSIFVAVAFVLMLIAAQVDYRLFAWERKTDARFAWLLFGFTIILLIVVLIPGIGVRRLGAARAIQIPGFVSFQPSEFAKITLCLWLSAFLTRPGADPRSLRGTVLPALIGSCVLIALVGIEDFGTAALLGVVMFGMLYVAGAKLWHLGVIGLLGILGGAGLILSRGYRSQRLLTFFSDTPDPLKEGYQVTQSLIAIAGGGWWGRGLGGSVQKHDYLPQDNNDFIFAILCEELGVVGGLCVICLFLLLLIRGWRISSCASTGFGRLLAAGITLTLGLQAAFNIGVVTNSVPTKGISLPFVSEGGSGVICLGIAAGLLASVARSRVLGRPG